MASTAQNPLTRWLIRAGFGSLVVGSGALAGAALVYELETSALQARLFARYASRLSYQIEPGPSQRIVFPVAGPIDRRRGYVHIPDYQQRLETIGMKITEQAQVSRELARLLSWGVSPPYEEPPVTGLVLRAADGRRMHDAVPRMRVYRNYEDVPPILVKTLLFIENQELLDATDPRSNPTLEWDRMAKATLLYVGSKMGLPVSVQGGSTLATQLEKFRHSPDGRTSSARDKLRQITAASLKAYRQGEDTTSRRREIVVEYLNTMPLAAAPGYGEVYGLGEGLYAWFGMSLAEVDRVLRETDTTQAKAQAYKHVLALLAALPSPSTLLVKDRDSLERRMNAYLWLLAERGVIEPEIAEAARSTPLVFLSRAPLQPARDFVERKAASALRNYLLETLGISSLYELDQLHLEVDTTIDAGMQQSTIGLFRELADRKFVKRSGLDGEHLLEGADPSKVLYSLLLFERTPVGNVLRVQADNLDQPLDINRGGKMELGSTAKLRTLAHYLETVAGLHEELAGLDVKALAERAKTADDPITRWAVQTLRDEHGLGLEPFLETSLERRYSASPGESFFTGGGMHAFENFDRLDNGRILTVREAFQRSTNLVFIRLMRDVVRYHQARLPYDVEAVLNDPDDQSRLHLLEEIGDEESRRALSRAYRRYRGLPASETIARLLGRQASSRRHLTIVFYALHRDGTPEELATWLATHGAPAAPSDLRRLVRAYSNPRLNISDFGYLLSRHPLEVWTVRELVRYPDLAWEEILERSTEARRVSSSWLFKTRNRRAQDRRLRIRIEQDAFTRMTPAWQRLGFPFDHLVPSYATSIGSSGDRPAALADLVGIVLNEGLHRRTVSLQRLRFGRWTPWETAFEPTIDAGERVMRPEVAHVLRASLASVVERGTGRRVAGAFVRPDGSRAVVGGKTGTGDNRFQTFHRGGGVRSSRALNRTATFVFFVEDRYFGVLTAAVLGKDAARYAYTSSLPLAVLKLLSPQINTRLESPAGLRLVSADSPPEGS